MNIKEIQVLIQSVSRHVENGLLGTEKGRFIEKNKELSQTVFDSIKDGICILDSNLNILSVNSSMKCWYSHRSPLIGEKCFKVYHNRDNPCIDCPTIETLETGCANMGIVPYLSSSDRIQGWQELYSYPVFQKNNKLTGVVEYVRDITIQENVTRELLGLKKKIKALETKNASLDALVKQKDNEKRQLEESILYNVNKLIRPSLKRLKNSLCGTDELESVLLIEYLIDGIVSPFSKKLSEEYLSLTPREIQILSLIKEGKTSKEISNLLFVSTKTVDFHRANIRKKLGLTNTRTNLMSYLLNYLKEDV